MGESVFISAKEVLVIGYKGCSVMCDNAATSAQDHKGVQPTAEAIALRVLTELPLEEDRVITRGLMLLSEKTLARVFENEPDIYTVEDLKAWFR
jgi:hypothetical protein